MPSSAAKPRRVRNLGGRRSIRPRRSQVQGYRLGRSSRSRFSAGSITPMRERRELGSHLAALQPLDCRDRPPSGHLFGLVTSGTAS